MYCQGNPKTKKALKEMVANGTARAFLANAQFTGFEEHTDGVEYIEGPHYPKPHRWYAQVMLEDGRITKVIS